MTVGSVAVLGTEPAGLALAVGFASSEEVARVTVFGRHSEPPEHPVVQGGGAEYVFGLRPLARDVRAVLVAAPAEELHEVVHSLAGHGPAPEGCVALLVSGTLPTDVLAPLHGAGYGVGSFHPIAALGGVGRARPETFRGTFVALSGSPGTVATAARLARAIGAETLTVPEGRRPLYDAAITMAGGYLPPLLDHAARLMERAGVSPDDALAALVSLVRGTLDAIEASGPVGAASGPVDRGDVDAVSLHLRALDPEDRRLYALFGTELLRLADGLDPRKREELEELFLRYLEPETVTIGERIP